MRAFIATLLSAVAFAAKPPGGYDYNEGGDDWNTIYADMENNICGLTTSKEQSPINLLTTGDNLTLDKDISISIEGLGSQAKASRDTATTNMETNW